MSRLRQNGISPNKQELFCIPFFFIPIIPFGVSYLATYPNCISVMKLSKEKGKAFEQNHSGAIYNGDFNIAKQHRPCLSIVQNENNN